MERTIQFLRSVRCAFKGLIYIIKNEKNFQNELIAALVVIVGIVYFPVTQGETLVLILTIMAVLFAEIVNTILERIVDILKPKVHPYARLVKDLMAAGVLLISFTALIVGIIIFIPYISEAFMF